MIGMEPDRFAYLGLAPSGVPVKVFADRGDALAWVDEMTAGVGLGWHMVAVPFQPPQ